MFTTLSLTVKNTEVPFIYLSDNNSSMSSSSILQQKFFSNFSKRISTFHSIYMHFEPYYCSRWERFCQNKSRSYFDSRWQKIFSTFSVIFNPGVRNRNFHDLTKALFSYIIFSVGILVVQCWKVPMPLLHSK